MQQQHQYQPCRSTEPCKPSAELIDFMDRIVEKYGRGDAGDIPGGQKSLQGVPVATGVAVGRAVVVRGPEDLEKVVPDSILLCLRMAPVYSIVFGMVRGIVTETGGILTTAGSVARKYGLPAVTGVRDAGNIVADGDIIRIDGTNGSIQILSRAR